MYLVALSAVLSRHRVNWTDINHIVTANIIHNKSFREVLPNTHEFSSLKNLFRALSILMGELCFALQLLIPDKFFYWNIVFIYVFLIYLIKLDCGFSLSVRTQLYVRFLCMGYSNFITVMLWIWMEGRKYYSSWCLGVNPM